MFSQLLTTSSNKKAQRANIPASAMPRAYYKWTYIQSEICGRTPPPHIPFINQPYMLVIF